MLGRPLGNPPSAGRTTSFDAVRRTGISPFSHLFVEKMHVIVALIEAPCSKRSVGSMGKSLCEQLRYFRARRIMAFDVAPQANWMPE